MFHKFPLTKPIFQVLAGAFLISFSPIFVKLANVSPTNSAFYRVFFGTLFLGLAACWLKTSGRLQRQSYFLIGFCGFIFSLDLFVWHQSILYIGPGLATLLGNFQVFLLALFGVLFLKEKVGFRFIISLPMAISGLFLLLAPGWSTFSSNYKIGIFLGFLTALCYAVYLLSLRKLQSTNDSFDILPLTLVSAASSVWLGLLIIFSSESFHIPDVQSLFSLLGLGFCSQTVGWLLIATAMPKIKASFTGLVLLLQPSLSFIWDVLFFDRQTSGLNWLGVVITLTAIYMGITGKGRDS